MQGFNYCFFNQETKFYKLPVTKAWFKLTAYVFLFGGMIQLGTILLDYFLYDLRLDKIWYRLVLIADLSIITAVGYRYIRLKPTMVHKKKIQKYLEESDLEKRATIQAVGEEILKKIENNQLYLDKNLTQESLSKSLEISPKKLSEIINQVYQLNFFDFINSLRCKEVKKLIQNNVYEDKTIFEIGLACGFSSKSTFNRAFKKSERITPSEFIRKVHGN